MNKLALPKLLVEKIAAANDAIALKSNKIFASMFFFWTCLVFSLLPLKWPSTLAVVQYASSGVLQLIALPLLGVGTILAARASDKLGAEQHAAVMETVKDMRILMDEIHQMHKELHAKLGAPLTILDPFGLDGDGAGMTPEKMEGAKAKAEWNDLTMQVLRSNLTPEQVLALRDAWLAKIVPNPAVLNQS
jgi:hypothetical protein